MTVSLNKWNGEQFENGNYCSFCGKLATTVKEVDACKSCLLHMVAEIDRAMLEQAVKTAENSPIQPLPEWILLLPAGQVELLGRLEPLQVDSESLASMVAAFRSRGLDLVIDYEHQSLQGRQAPAAGWIKDLEGRPDGLWARVEWTSQAREYLHNRKYRYFSPVLQLDPETRKPLALMQVGLTNISTIKHIHSLS
jgi:phage I-like protein